MQFEYPFISIIVPCRNESDRIASALFSLIDNFYPRDRMEIIVVDGMSTDDTMRKLEAFEETYWNIKILRNEKKTTPYAFNIGIREAMGNIILRADAHAEYPRTYVSDLVDKLKKNPATMNAGGRLSVEASNSNLLKNALNTVRNTPFGPQSGNHVPDLIMFAGAHCEYPKDYLRKCAERSGNGDNVGGCIEAVRINGKLMFKTVDTVRSDVFGIGKSEYRQKGIQDLRFKIQDLEENKKAIPEGILVDTVFGGCYRREVFEKIGLFNEKLTRGQDLEFNLRLKRAGMKTVLYPDIVVKYYPKNQFLPFLKHALEDGFWITNAVSYADKPVTLRHLVPLLFVMFLPLSIFPYIPVNVFRSFQLSMKMKDLRMVFILPWVFFLFHLLYGAGSILGLLNTIVNKLKGGIWYGWKKEKTGVRSQEPEVGREKTGVREN